MRNKTVYLFLLLFLPLCLWAENASNVRVRQRNKDIIIIYDLNELSYVNVSVTYGVDESFRPLKAVSGAVGKHVRAGKNKEIVWHPLDEEESFIAENVRFKVEAMSPYEWYALPKSRMKAPQGGKTNVETFILGDFAYASTPQTSGGLTIGQTYSGIGWFISARSNFRFQKATEGMTCDKGGYINGDMPFYSGYKKSSAMVVNVGGVVDIFEWTKVSSRNRFNTLGVYLGVGYGYRHTFWGTTNGAWIKYRPTSYKGACTDIGIIGSIYGLTLKVGMNTIAFKYLEMEAGLGWMF